jgi:hypothetical protein
MNMGVYIYEGYFFWGDICLDGRKGFEQAPFENELV